jgi:hypothetical protein
MATPPAATQPIGGLSPDAFASLFQAVGGLRNTRALIAMFSCFVTGIVLAALLGFALGMLGSFGALLGALVSLLAIWTGVNAAGVLLMDQAKGVPSRGLVDALVYGLMCIPKVVVLGLAFFAVALGVFIVIALVYVVCKIPVLGPLLYTVVFPLSVVVAGVTIWGLFICMFLSLPAIWEGAGIMAAVSQSLAIVRSRIVETLLLMTFVWLLAFIVGLIVFGVLGMGMVPSMSMSAWILGAGGSGFGGLMGAMQGFGGGGHAIAGGIGSGVLFAIASTLVSQVYLLGLNIVYLRVSEGLDASATRQALQQKLDEAKKRAADMGQKAREAAERAREQGRQSAMPPAAPVAPAAPRQPVVPAPAMEATQPAARIAPAPLTCPACHAAVTADDVFCEACGHRLR